MSDAVRFQAAGVRITDAAIETSRRRFLLGEAVGLEERRFLGTDVALVVSVLFMAMIVAMLGGTQVGRDAVFYTFLAAWSVLVALLAYAAVAMSGLRVRTAAKTIPLGGRFTRRERREIIAAFTQAKAALTH